MKYIIPDLNLKAHFHNANMENMNLFINAENKF